MNNANQSAFPQEVAYLLPNQSIIPHGPKGGLTKLEWLAGMVMAMQGITADAAVARAKALLAALEQEKDHVEI